MEAWHGIHDSAKVTDLRASLRRSGWVGVPLVALDDVQLITGVHRYAAARAEGWTDAEIPVILLADVFAADGKDLTAIVEADDLDLADPADVVWLVGRLSPSTAEAYGIDIR